MNRKLKTAYKVLFDKNVEIIELQNKIPETSNNDKDTLNRKLISAPENNNEKSKKIVLPEPLQKELLSRILAFMENTSQICNPDFTMERLSESIHSNHLYVSHVINNILKKNFNSFLNSYRIRESQKLFSDPNTSKYTVEFVAKTVGYKSRNSFNEAFKEITGITPGFYTKALNRNS